MKFLRKIDNYLGALCSLTRTGYTEVDIWESKSKESMDKIEWDLYRESEKIKGKSITYSWFSILAKKERRQFFLFNELCEILNYDRVLELGSGQGHVGVFLNLVGINVDLSEYSDNLLAPNVEGLQVSSKKLDFRDISAEELVDYGCVFSIQLDYMFDYAEISRFFEQCMKSKTDIIFVNSQIIGPLNYINYFLRQKSREVRLKKHGFVRTLGFYKKLANMHNMKISIQRFKYAPINSYYLMKFTNDKKPAFQFIVDV